MKHFLRGRIGWWILHAAAVAIALYLGTLVRY